MDFQSCLPPILIASHEFSGARFLRDALVSNFAYDGPDNDWPIFDGEENEFRRFACMTDAPIDQLIGTSPTHGESGLLKSHYAFGFYADWLRNFGSQLRIIYIVRDVLPVMRNFQCYLRQRSRTDVPQVTDASEFIRAEPTGEMLRFQDQPARTMVHRWAQHVLGWLDGAKQQNRRSVTVLRFDALVEDFDLTIQNLANSLSLHLPSRAVLPRNFPRDSDTQFPYFIDPACDDFRLTDEDLEFITDTTRTLYERLGSMGRSITIY